MALVVPSSSRSRRASSTASASGDPFEPLAESVRDFESQLSPQQRTRLRELKSIPDAEAVMTFTAELDAVSRSKRQRSVAIKLHAFLQSTGDFSQAINTPPLSSNPGIAAMVWGSVKFIMLVRSM